MVDSSKLRAAAADRVDVLVAGRVFCDLIFSGLDAPPALGRERFAQQFTVTAGGGAFITAAHLVNLGMPAGVIGHLGTDMFSTLVGAELARRSIDQTGLTRVSGPLPRVTAAAAADEDRAFVTHVAQSAEEPDYPTLFAATGARWVHVGDLASLNDLPGLVPAVRAAGLTLSIDVGWSESALADPVVWDTLSVADILLPNTAEAAALAGTDESPEGLQAAIEVLASRVPMVVIKAGRAGLMAARAAERIAVPTIPVPVVDATGAGDACDAGLIYGLLQGWPLERAMRLGARLGGWTVGRPGGAETLPHRDDMVADPLDGRTAETIIVPATVDAD